MVESTADDHLTLDGDAMFVGADPEHASGSSLSRLQTIGLLTAALSGCH